MAFLFLLLVLLMLTGGPFLALRYGPRRGRVEPPIKAFGRAFGVLLGPVLVPYLLLITLSVLSYKGRCGGWLGETTACTLPTFLAEQATWGFYLLMLPSLGVLAVSSVIVLYRLLAKEGPTQTPPTPNPPSSTD
jgi:hypothetical protein